MLCKTQLLFRFASVLLKPPKSRYRHRYRQRGMPDIRPLGLRRKFWMMERYRYFRTPDIMEERTAAASGIINMPPTKDVFICPHGEALRHTTTDRNRKRMHRSTPKNCVSRPSKAYCEASKKGQKLFKTHIWQAYFGCCREHPQNRAEQADICAAEKTIERGFAVVKEKHAMCYTHHRGMSAVIRWVRLKYAAMNLKKLAEQS